MKLRLNLSTAPRENRRPFLAAATLIGVIGLIALAILSRASYRSWQSNRDARANVAELEKQIRESSARQAQLAAYFRTSGVQKILDRANFLNSLIGERSFPWTKIFAALEETLPAGVRVVSISPKLINGRAELSLTIGAANDEQKIHFLKAMEESKSFSNVQISSEHDATDPSGPDRVMLELKVVYETT
jgi:Tfp pilus assembly protein PilN